MNVAHALTAEPGCRCGAKSLLATAYASCADGPRRRRKQGLLTALKPHPDHAILAPQTQAGRPKPHRRGITTALPSRATQAETSLEKCKTL
jgi:hypothetical protein